MDTQEHEVFLFPSPEVQALLADNGTDLVELLKREGVEVRRGFATDPAASAASGHKDPATVIIASAALVAALTPILSQALAALTHKTLVVREEVIVPVEDSKGNVVRDANGQPLVHWVARDVIRESSMQPDGYDISIKGPLGIAIEMKSSRKE